MVVRTKCDQSRCLSVVAYSDHFDAVNIVIMQAVFSRIIKHFKRELTIVAFHY